MKLKLNDKIYELVSAENSAYFNDEVEQSRRLSVTLENSNLSIDEFIDLRGIEPVLIYQNENELESEITFPGYKIESIRRNFNLSGRVTLDYKK